MKKQYLILVLILLLNVGGFGQQSTGGSTPADTTGGWKMSVPFVYERPHSKILKKVISMGYEVGKGFVQKFTQGDTVVTNDAVFVSYFLPVNRMDHPIQVRINARILPGSRIPADVKVFLSVGLYDSTIPTAGWTETKDIDEQWNDYTWDVTFMSAPKTDYFELVIVLYNVPSSVWRECSVEVSKIDFQLKNGDWLNVFNPATDVPRLNPLPTSCRLEQNYPNPFNPATVIKFKVPSSQVVTLKVYDLLGREVATLVNEEKSPGNYEVKFDGNNLASGMYIYRLQSGSTVLSKKMLLMK